VEGCGDVTGIKRRNIGSDEQHWTRGAGFERAAHSDPEIARALSDRLYHPAPMTGAAAGLVRRHRDPQAPAPIRCETAQQQRDHCPLETKRRDIADLAREAAFAAAE
jgi:hypothetical protein